MKYKLNKLPVKTTNNFKINDIELELDIPNNYSFHNFEIENKQELLINIEVKENISTKIGLDFKKYLNIDITIPKNVIIKEPVLLTYNFTNNDVLIDKININYEENSYADIIIRYKSIDNTKHFHHLKEIITNKDNSKGSISIINLLNEKSINMTAIESEVLENVNITNNLIDLGGNTRLYNIYSENKGYNAYNNLNNIYIGNKENIIDMNYYYKNISKKSNNIIRVEGCLDDNSKKNFRGTIDFIKGCTNSLGEENENCVLLSDTARSRSLPQLLCAEEDVIGAHGVSSGKVSKDRLFYIMSRGYTKKDAEKLIILANFTSIIEKIKSDIIKEEILDTIDKIISIEE